MGTILLALRHPIYIPHTYTQITLAQSIPDNITVSIQRSRNGIFLYFSSSYGSLGPWRIRILYHLFTMIFLNV